MIIMISTVLHILIQQFVAFIYKHATDYSASKSLHLLVLLFANFTDLKVVLIT